MAGSSLAIRSMATMQLPSVSRRTISTSSALRTKLLRPTSFSQPSCITRRTYADAAPTPVPNPAPKPKKRFRLLRWSWRLTWLAGIGLTGALGYSIYSLRHPEEQFEVDPDKKTLVILGMSRSQGL